MNALWQTAQKEGWAISLKRLHRRRPITSVITVLVDWAAILASFYAVFVYGAWAVPPALLVIGNRQRALIVMLHDASHRCISSRRQVNDLFGRLFLAWPMFMSLTYYRRLHDEHHRYLGDPVRDTDYFDPNQFKGLSWQRMLITQLFGRRNLINACIGQWLDASTHGRVGILAWATTSIATCWLQFGATAVVQVVGLWMAARLLVYHPIVSFVIISDHVGLPPGSILSSTRNHPPGTWSWLIHPHGDGWHLTHHLLPWVPSHALSSAHELLLRWLPYADAEHCDCYFGGQRSVVASWRRHAETPNTSC